MQSNATVAAIFFVTIVFWASVATPISVPRAPVLTSYTPIKATCPRTPLVRPATGLSADEKSYTTERKKLADQALVKWLKKTNPAFGTGNLPTVGLTVSGGGYRSLLLGGGVIQGLDDRDSNVSTSGLYQALTYHGGLSGGSWLLSSLAGNDYPTITYLKENLWKLALEVSLLIPGNLMVSSAYTDIINDILSKQNAGFAPTLADPWGRLLSYQVFFGDDGGASKTLSSIANMSTFQAYQAPFPIIAAVGVKTFSGDCVPGPNATAYEFTPFEFGSWDSDVSAFTPTQFLGTNLTNGQPVDSTSCIRNNDNLGYIFGTSSNLFNTVCLPAPSTNSQSDIFNNIAGILDKVHAAVTRDLYGVFRNPFYQYISESSVPNSANPIPSQKELFLVDSGEARQDNPIFPFLQPSRGVSVLLVNDNCSDPPHSFPNGSKILTTYVQSFNHNLTRMPPIPSAETFLSQGLTKRAVFFGCAMPEKITIVWIPNVNYTTQSNVLAAQLEYSRGQTDAMVANGVQMITQGGDGEWGTCLGCAIMAKTGEKLPLDCAACFKKYCYTGPYGF